MKASPQRSSGSLDTNVCSRYSGEHMFAKILIMTVLAAAAVGWVMRPSESAKRARHFVGKPGDSLWSIAASRCAVDTRKAIWRIEQRNPQVRAGLQPGDKLT